MGENNDILCDFPQILLKKVKKSALMHYFIQKFTLF